jgi:hypothetical protein
MLDHWTPDCWNFTELAETVVILLSVCVYCQLHCGVSLQSLQALSRTATVFCQLMPYSVETDISLPSTVPCRNECLVSCSVRRFSKTEDTSSSFSQKRCIAWFRDYTSSDDPDILGMLSPHGSVVGYFTTSWWWHYARTCFLHILGDWIRHHWILSSCRRRRVSYMGRFSRIVAIWNHGQHGDNRFYTEPISET